METRTKQQIEAIKSYCKEAYPKCFREAKGTVFPHPFIVPGASYQFQLWDWDSWTTGIALEDIAEEDISEYQRGCVLDFLSAMDEQGRVPINIREDKNPIAELFSLSEKETNIHKPCLAQHALFVLQHSEDRGWLSVEDIEKLERFIAYYDAHQKHPCGLYFFFDDFAIGADNDPSIFYRPRRSTGSLLLNCLMQQELSALAEIERMFGREQKAIQYEEEAETLAETIRRECYDPRDEFFYSVDLNLNPVDPDALLHRGGPRDYESLPIRITYWTSFLPLWAGIATKEQAEAFLARHLKDEKGLWSPSGIRSLGTLEKMYNMRKQGNPSNWQGPIWGIANYFAFEGLLRYGHEEDAKELAKRLIRLFGEDILEHGLMHEYYDPETGKGINNPGFQSWNMLMYRICEWYEGHGE